MKKKLMFVLALFLVLVGTAVFAQLGGFTPRYNTWYNAELDDWSGVTPAPEARNVDVTREMKSSISLIQVQFVTGGNVLMMQIVFTDGHREDLLADKSLNRITVNGERLRLFEWDRVGNNGRTGYVGYWDSSGNLITIRLTIK